MPSQFNHLTIPCDQNNFSDKSLKQLSQKPSASQFSTGNPLSSNFVFKKRKDWKYKAKNQQQNTVDYKELHRALENDNSDSLRRISDNLADQK